MNEKIIPTINRFLGKNKIWPLVVIIMGISYIFIQVNNTLQIGNYFTTILLFVLLTSPIFILQLGNFSKNDFNNTYVFYLFYGLIYLLFPLIIVLLGIDGYLLSNYLPGDNSSGGRGSGEIFPVVYTLLAGLQIAIFKLPSLINLKVKWKALMKIKSFKAYSFLLLFFAIFIPFMSNEFGERIQSFSVGGRLFNYIIVVIQFFLIYLSYYFVYYLHHHIAFNFLLKKKGLLYYLAGILGIIFLVTPLINIYVNIFPIVSDLKLHTVGLSEYILSDINNTFTLATLIISLPFILIIEWNKQAMSITQLQQEKTSSELNLLKQQINPHFFFNTLNNLYSMSLTQEKNTPETIIQLSELMRYVIYKGKEEMVLLEDDIKYIQDYIDLQKIRIHKKLNYSFHIEPYDKNVKVPPLLFIILIENAFKHGIEPAENDCHLHIDLRIESGLLYFTCSNSKESEPKESPGIGLENLQKRLDLLFDEDYDLILEDQENEFKATLMIRI